jgi:TRAP-type mannitol/chloroaromatic compound transport system permease small subunit
MLPRLLTLASWYDALTRQLGRAASWLILGSIVVSAANAIAGWGFGASSNAWGELQWYLFTAAFMLAAPYTLQRNEHIRIDIVTSRFSKRTRDWIDVFGHLAMLLPFTALMVWLCAPYFLNAFRSGEISGSANGLVLWPLRLVILAGFVLLFLQGVSELIKRIGVIQGMILEPYTATSQAPPAAAIPDEQRQ